MNTGQRIGKSSPGFFFSAFSLSLSLLPSIARSINRCTSKLPANLSVVRAPFTRFRMLFSVHRLRTMKLSVRVILGNERECVSLVPRLPCIFDSIPKSVAGQVKSRTSFAARRDFTNNKRCAAAN